MSLHEIRNKESDIKRRIAEARQEADASLDRAREKAERIKVEARDQGKQAGEAETKRILVQAGEETEQMVKHAKQWAEDFAERKQKIMDQQVKWATGVVLGRDNDRREK